MSSQRKLTTKLEWPEDIRAVELLNWETRPEDFHRLCEFIVAKFAERDHLTRDQLFRILPEDEFRRQIRACAENFTERSWSLVAYVYLRMKLLVIPEAARTHEKDEP